MASGSSAYAGINKGRKARAGKGKASPAKKRAGRKRVERIDLGKQTGQNSNGQRTRRRN